jgi:hypothetical protein
MPGQQAGRAQPEAFGRAGRQVLHEHVGPGQQRGHDRAAVVALHVELDRLLAPVQPDEVAGLAEHRRVVAAGEVAGPGPLDLDHPGAQVSQLPGRERCRDRLLQRHDQQAVQRPSPAHEPAGWRWTS